jgi:micrococcal nuclease
MTRLSTFAAAISLAAATFVPAREAFANEISVTVIACNDGDTCRLRKQDGEVIKLRLVGIDAPETRGNRKKNKKRQPFAIEAKSFLNKISQNKVATLKSYGVDSFGRQLGELWVDGKNINVSLVGEGFAECYRGRPPKGYNTAACETAEKTAKAQKRGIWSLDTYESPKDFRRK